MLTSAIIAQIWATVFRQVDFLLPMAPLAIHPPHAPNRYELVAVVLGLIMYLAARPSAAPPIDHVDVPEF